MHKKSSVNAPARWAWLLASFSVVISIPAAAAPPDAQYEDGFANPFAQRYDDPSGWVRTGVHMGSSQRDGFGPRLWIVPWRYAELSASYGYGTEHSFVGTLSVPIFPLAELRPYVVSGYALALTRLPYGLRMYTHQVVGGLGMDARVLGRYYLGAEVTLNTVWKVTLKNKDDTMDLTAGDRYSFVSGIHMGVSL